MPDGNKRDGLSKALYVGGGSIDLSSLGPAFRSSVRRECRLAFRLPSTISPINR